MTILITGSGGFLGKHVLKAMNTADIPYLAPSHHELDILDYTELSRYLFNNEPTTILHLAARCGGIKKNASNPATFLRDNTQMALNIYEAARENNITNIYSLGTVCAYGNLCPTPFKEDNLWEGGMPHHTNNPYSQAKRTLLMLGQAYREQYGFTGAHLIPANMYGQFDNFNLTDSHVIPALIRKFDNTKTNNLPQVECWGQGKQGATREFLFAGDCASAIVKTIQTNLNTNLPINIGTGQETSIYNLVYLIKDMIGYTGDIIFNGEYDGQPRRTLDVSRAKQLLNWQATTSLTDGLKQTISWYQENKHNLQ